jgi:hypothetical protein
LGVRFLDPGLRRFLFLFNVQFDSCATG